MHLLLKFNALDWKPLGLRKYPKRDQVYHVFHDVDTKRVQLETISPNPFEHPLVVSILSKKIDKQYFTKEGKKTEKIIHCFVFREMTQVSSQAIIRPARLVTDCHRGVIGFPKFSDDYLWTGAVYKKDSQDGKMLVYSIEQTDQPLGIESPEIKALSKSSGFRLPLVSTKELYDT